MGCLARLDIMFQKKSLNQSTMQYFPLIWCMVVKYGAKVALVLKK